MQLSNIATPHLNIPHWHMQSGECWAVLGRNGSGKRYLAELLCGNVLPENGSVSHQYRTVALLSFERQQALYEAELRNDDSDFIDRQDPGTTVAELLGLTGSESTQMPAHLPAELQFLDLEKLLHRGYRLLSSGEARKTLLAQAILQQPDLLILDEPFDSLDLESRGQLARFFEQLLADGRTTLLFLLNTIEDIFPWHSHVALMEKGAVVASGTREDILANSDAMALLHFDPAALPSWPEPLVQSNPQTRLVDLNKGHVRYGDTQIFDNIDLHIARGSHTLITGRNGSGKSTLLSLITGDNPQCYGNDLSLFGQRRGTGESIWDIKRQIGIVSPGLHRDHRVPGSALEIVLSGFFDSIGLYESTNALQVQHARRWLALVGLQTQSDVAFKQLSYGEQRLVLVARALVKQPALLVLDEPTQGLDDVNRHRVLYFLEHLSTQQHTTIIMASHRQDEHLPLFKCHLAL